MSEKKNLKQEKSSVNYFKKSDTLQYVGGGLLIVSLISLWLGWGMISYIFAIIGTPTGLILFLVGASGKISDQDMDNYIQNKMADLKIDIDNDRYYLKGVHRRRIFTPRRRYAQKTQGQQSALVGIFKSKNKDLKRPTLHHSPPDILNIRRDDKHQIRAKLRLYKLGHGRARQQKNDVQQKHVYDQVLLSPHSLRRKRASPSHRGRDNLG